MTAHPPLLRELVTQCETLRRRLAADHNAETARELADATYTLCVITGTRQLDAAQSVARRQLTEAVRREQPLHRWLSPRPKRAGQDCRHVHPAWRWSGGTTPSRWLCSRGICWQDRQPTHHAGR
ncbi:DUF5133 domain-containing protein [Streptomyces sp. NPDC001920]